MNSAQNMNRTKFEHQECFYNFYSLHISLGRVLMMPSLSEKNGAKFP
jgi:hypothetical protein